MNNPPWFYISFSRYETFLGASIVQAANIFESPEKAKELGINPGGSMLIVQLTEEQIGIFPSEIRNKLLTKEQLEKYTELVTISFPN